MRLVVIGGGAAGFFCAVNAARMAPLLSVSMVERSGKLLSKVRVSGGGRCNLTHACFDIAEMSRRYPRGSNFVRKAFHQFFTSDTIQWFESRGVKIKQEADGRMFPVTDSSESVIDCLIREANRYKVDIRLNRDVKHLKHVANTWQIEYSNGDHEEADFVCIAAGGQPKVSMFEWIRETGHSVEDPVPSLFTFNLPGNDITELMGLSVQDVTVKISGSKLVERGPILITHWGLSGPVILRLSAWGARELAELQYHFSAVVNWLPDYHEQSFREFLISCRTEWSGQLVHSKNTIGLPTRLWKYFLLKASIAETQRWQDLPNNKINLLVRLICAFEIHIRGKTTFKEEFVTAGGVVLSEINVQQMESKKQSGLFFAGEILNVDGITGGYNFQHAWTSGYIAALAISERVRQSNTQQESGSAV